VHPDGALRPIDGRPGTPRDFPHPKATPQHEQNDGPVSARVDDLEQADQVILGHGPGKHLRHEDLMTTRLNGVVGQQRVLLEEGAEAPDHTERRMDRGGRSALARRTLEPGIDIHRRQTGHILPEAWLPSGGKDSREGHEGSQGRLQRVHAIVTGSQVSQVIRHEVLVEGTDEGQPMEGQGRRLRRPTVLLLHAPLMWGIREESR
jgi:hypothetical protein